MYYTYMLRCRDNSIYTGMAENLERRMKEHFSKDERCAKYTLSHDAIKLEIAWGSENRSQASKLEYYIKRLSKTQKENLINNPDYISKYLENKLDYAVYNLVDIKNIKYI